MDAEGRDPNPQHRYPITDNIKITTPMHKGDAFGNFQKISRKIGSMGLKLVEPHLRGATVGDAGQRSYMKDSLSSITHILVPHALTHKPTFVFYDFQQDSGNGVCDGGPKQS
jgi:hypothetical protein